MWNCEDARRIHEWAVCPLHSLECFGHHVWMMPAESFLYTKYHRWMTHECLLLHRKHCSGEQAFCAPGIINRWYQSGHFCNGLALHATTNLCTPISSKMTLERTPLQWTSIALFRHNGTKFVFGRGHNFQKAKSFCMHFWMRASHFVICTHDHSTCSVHMLCILKAVCTMCFWKHTLNVFSFM